MNTVIIDVRTPKEFNDGAIPGAINIPSTDMSIEGFDSFRNNHICLVCANGKRATQVQIALTNAGFQNVSLLDKHMNDLLENRTNSSIWNIDRQFRLILSVFLAIFLLGYQFDLHITWMFPVILFSGLLFSAITDNCYLKMLIARLLWNL